ncbi:MAG: hypothetical protein IKJ45_16940 [Kiritimatiellae bacterium]|nr:hypothetical protein [Kiritimatiellia bacterium]
MKMKVLAGAAIAAAAMVVSGCHTYPGTIHDKSKPMNQNGYTVVGEEVSATECQVSVFGIGVSDVRGSAGRRMYKTALAKAPGADALIEYTTDVRDMNLGPVFLQWFTLTGVPVKTNK